MTPLWSDKREEMPISVDDLGIEVDRICNELKADFKERGFWNMRGVITAGLFVGESGFELCGSQLGGRVSVTLMLAMLLHSELHDAGIIGGVPCMVLDALEDELRARLEALS